MPFAGVGGTSVRDSQYLIDNSLRFNDNDSAYLNLSTSGSPTSSKKCTFSFWVKRGNLGIANTFFSAGSSEDRIGFSQVTIGTDSIEFVFNNTGNGAFFASDNGTFIKFRDTSAWYHFVVAIDTTLATADDRLKFYQNGNLIPHDNAISGSSPVSGVPITQNYDLKFLTSGNNFSLGRNTDGSGEYLDGYLAEVHFIDGQQLAPTDFAEADEDSGIWKPIEYSGSYGNYGFYLDFENSGSLGADQSGNGNNFTPTNLASTDQTTDTPTNNFCTLNPLFTGNGAQLAEANTKVTLQNGTAGWTSCASTIALPSVGKYYAEFKVINYVNGFMGLGFYLDGQTQLQGNTSSTGANNANWWSQYGHDSNFYNNGVAYSGGQTWSSGILMLAHDADTGKVWWGHNGTWFNSGNPATGTNAPFTITRNGRNLYMIVEGYNGVVWEANFGNPPFSISSGNTDDNEYGNFEYAPPSGYLALCTQNLATELSPTIDDPSAHFQVKLYSGNNTETAITYDGNSNLQPDFIWAKSRSNAHYHDWRDTSRGLTKRLYSNDTGAEDIKSASYVSFDSNGFTLGDDIQNGSPANTVNSSGNNYASWGWRAGGGTTSSNTDGSITSTVQANTTAGFSIVTYTAQSDGNDTVGHGLLSAPDIVFWKARTKLEDWLVTSTLFSNPARNFLKLNLSDPVQTFGADAYSITNTTIRASTRLDDTDNYVAYCFHSVEGYSKFGSYTGNGSSDGIFIYTGFRPAFVIVKRTDASGFSWGIYDNKRPEYNLVDRYLMADQSLAEQSGNNQLDLLSNGMKMRSSNGGTNTSGATYIYMAFAENPFVTSGAVPVTAR